MGYDLYAKNKDAGEFHFGAFSWPWLLDAGVGLAIGQGPGFSPASYFYQPDRKGRDPMSNDGFHVKAADAKLMARLARVVVDLEKNRAEAFDKLPTETKAELSSFGSRTAHIYKMPVRDDFRQKALEFADWAEKSGGFTIH